MKWIPIDSSVFTAVAYVPGKRLLHLRFQSGEVYRYFDFSPEQFEDFLSAESKGRYFSSSIRDKFRCDRLARLTVIAPRPRSEYQEAGPKK